MEPPRGVALPLHLLALALILTLQLDRSVGSLDAEVIGEWAKTFGEELWNLGQRISKAPEIKKRYEAAHLRVERKDGHALLQTIAETVASMLSRKVDALKCIAALAQDRPNEADANVTYYSAKYSQVDGRPHTLSNKTRKMKFYRENSWAYKNMTFYNVTYLYNISVNTNYSMVHVPTYVYDRDPEIIDTIAWSEALDRVFIQNNKLDPAMSWQYFCSSVGVMRLYPAMDWTRTDGDQAFDCRIRPWYIEVSTCCRNVIVLLDNSGSMTGYNNLIATFTVRAILDTLFYDDFVNIVAFSEDAFEIVPCFRDVLVQATPDNLRDFNEALTQLKPDGIANFTNSVFKAFELFDNFWSTTRDDGSRVGCNNAIMFITDGVQANLTQILDTPYLRNNGTHTPVRIFTYLVGKEVDVAREIQRMTCLYGGHYFHIESLGEVQEKVLKYLSFVAKCLESETAVTWTHAYADKHHCAGCEDYRIMMSPVVPLYHRRVDEDTGSQSTDLLGVAGVDVPIEDIEKLMSPHKLGVNGYSFIVRNDGYLLLHPGLKSVYKKGFLKENYNTVDILEVEMMDDDRGGLGSSLREAMVGGAEGSVLGVSGHLHYDDTKRLSREKLDYHYAPLLNTPFSLAIVLPHGYGKTWINAGDEIKSNRDLGLKVEEYFLGDNWTVHPKWVYCKNHSSEGRSTSEELLYFLRKMDEPDWKWTQQYAPKPKVEPNQKIELTCDNKPLDVDKYYCNEDLVQLLVSDAKLTDSLYNPQHLEKKEELFQRYNVSSRFIATMSGLTRWQYFSGRSSKFRDLTAIDEAWYKSAVLQHAAEAESFAFSVEYDAGYRNPQEVTVIASRAVFLEDGDLLAPVAVLGYQFYHHLLRQRFLEIISYTKCEEFMESCKSAEHTYYVIDSHGYIIISESHGDTGKLFCEVEGAVMEAMVAGDIFQKVSVLEQGVCFEEITISSIGNKLSNIVSVLVNWACEQLTWLLSQVNLSVHWVLLVDFPQTVKGTTGTETPNSIRTGIRTEEEEYFNGPMKVNRSFHCEKQTNLFVLQQHRFSPEGELTTNEYTNISRLFSVRKIVHSNLLLVVVDNKERLDPKPCRRVRATARPLGTEPCRKLQLANIPPGRPKSCYTDHLLNLQVEVCSRAENLQVSMFTILLWWFLQLWNRFTI